MSHDEAIDELAFLGDWLDEIGIGSTQGNATEGASDSETSRKKRGPRKADYKTIQKEAKLAEDWKRAQETIGTYKAVFAKSKGYKLKCFQRLLNRVAKRESRKGRSDN